MPGIKTNNEKKEEVMNTKYRKCRSIIMVLCVMMGLLVLAGVSSAGDDDTPFFAGDTGLPNVMFIFDNSDSMQDSPFLRKDGNTYRPSAYWRRGVKVDADGTIAENADGNIIYDNSKYVNRDEEIHLQGANPPELPGLGSSSSTVTYISGDSSDRIYDSNVDWTYFNENGWCKCAYTYRYWKVRITDANGAEQIRNIYHCYTGGYWRVYQNIDYTGPAPYTYEIMQGLAGEVTYKNESNLNLVYDRNFDWSTVTEWSDFSNNYRYKKLEVTAGTNAGETRNIAGRNTSYGYWTVDESFPEPCDHTTRYKILGSSDDNRYAFGGNHPDSKLYQAKQALNTFLESDAIRLCRKKDEGGNCIEQEYLLNMGFATYMSARVPRVRAKYYRKATYDRPDRCRAYYWRWRDTYSDFYDPDGPENGYDINAWGTEYDDVSIGDQIDRAYCTGRCYEQTIHYTVAEIEPSPSDSLPNRRRIRLRSRQGYASEGGYKYYTYIYFDVGDCSECDGYDYPDSYDDGNYQWTRAHECTGDYPPDCIPGGDGWYYQATYRDTYGDYGVTDSDTPRYIDKDTLLVAPEKGYEGSSWRRKLDPDPEAGDYTLVEETIEDEPIDGQGTTGDIEPNTFDYSYFRYPCDGSSDRVHAWSYRVTADGYTYRYSTSYASTWGDGIQNDPFFPADVGDEQANHHGDDQVVFVNLPAYDEEDENKGDDVTGQNVARILNYVSLARVNNPYHGSTSSMRYDYTMMPYTGSLASNSGSNYNGSGAAAVTGKGTPLAASLENAKRYYESYFEQDGYTQGGCRNNYVILLTDGLETCDSDPIAAAEALLNLSIEDTPAPVKTYVIGFGLDDASKDNLNAIAEAGGTKQAYFAINVEELVNVLTEDIMSEIVADSYTRSAPVVTRVFEKSDVDNLKIYYAYFDYPVWRGHLKAYSLNRDGSIGDPVAAWESGCDSVSGNDADAGCEIATHGRGTVYTVVNDTRTVFSSGNVSDLKSLVNPEGEDVDGNNTPDEDEDAEAVIEYTLAPGHDNNKYLGTRDPDWPLGDIYNSVPVVVRQPKHNMNFTGYPEFEAGEPQASRATMIYVGANDGMLHAINESNGREEWAWIPNGVLCTVHEFKEGHRFTVDLPIKAADVDTSKGCDGSGWKTMVMSGLRKGGNHYFAIDVTDPDNPAPMWEITEDNMGKTWSVPSFGRININRTPTSVIFVGGGCSADENKGNRVYILDAGTGAILKEITVGSATNNVPSEIRAMTYLVNRSGNPVDYITREEVDSDLKGFIEVAYFGGTDGTLYKLTGLNAKRRWDPQVEVLYKPVNPRPVYHRPAIADVYENCTRRFILFGTGDENAPTITEQNYFYEIEDRAFDDSEDGPDEGSSWTDEQIADGLFRMTWMKTLDLGEKVFSDPTAYRNVVYFTTYQPQGGCSMGLSYLYGLTTTQCGCEVGGKGGLEYDLEGKALDPHLEKIDLGMGIATTPVIAPPCMYIQIPKGGGGGMGPPTAIPVPMGSGSLLYWLEVD
jgi:hypothetical protein